MPLKPTISVSTSIGTMTDDNQAPQTIIKPTKISESTTSTMTSTDELKPAVKTTQSESEDRLDSKINSNKSEASKPMNSDKESSPVKILFSMENFFNYWLTSDANAPSTQPENDECNEFLKGKLVQYLMESMSQLQTDQNFTKMEPKSSMRNMRKNNSIEFNSTDPTDCNNRVSELFKINNFLVIY